MSMGVPGIMEPLRYQVRARDRDRVRVRVRVEG